MSAHRTPGAPGAPPAFEAAVAAVRAVRLRSEIVLSEVPAPARIAPFAVAVAGDVVVDGDELATGRFILLHDPSRPAEWGGDFRVVTYARADLEAELGGDPMLGQVGWSWLEEGLATSGALATGVGGTVTRVLSEGYGALAGRPASVDVELRASWTPADPADIAAHLHAWGVLVCTVAGLPPLPEGVLPIGRTR
ncbi:hypothetical protein FHR75_000509 [Kineococcus radiotolerans]|uniref:Uncharacterized protein n=1 Tax=Kineococcus radiotolerans TaxID=131568 RepID=A0A7W4TIU5_KINRA|nr:DUF3000 domain-containing protein [Kineococcus radiotolerans]MBB2899721.1 hypothetical protein [Kineococcus radiotolerans]